MSQVEDTLPMAEVAEKEAHPEPISVNSTSSLENIDLNASRGDLMNGAPPTASPTADASDGEARHSAPPSSDAAQESEEPSPNTSQASLASAGSTQTRQFPPLASPVTSPRQSFHRRRAPSLALSTSSSTDGTETKSAMVFIKSALETLKSSKDAKRIPSLSQGLDRVLDVFAEDDAALPAPQLIMEPLQLVCAQGASTEMRIVALDCIGKLFSFAYLEDEDLPEGQAPLINRAIAVVCDTFDIESTDPRIELQIVKALGAAVVNEDLVAHGRTLLDAIRQVYNIFVVSKSASNQNIAQVTLTQMIHAVFDRATALTGGSTQNSGHARDASVNGSYLSSQTASQSGSAMQSSEKLTLENMKKTTEEDPTGSAHADLIVKDAFFVFRTLCKLSEKLDVNVNNLKSHGMRSKLLSLHLLHSTLKHSISVFANKHLFVKFTGKQVRFVDAIKDYLCSTLSQNALSTSPPVFEISAEIFWILLSNLRSPFKREIQVFFKEIYLPILDLKSATVHQKLVFLNIVQRLCNDPRALVELYLNYDCDTSMPNIFEKIINVLVRISTAQVTMTTQSLSYYRSDKNKHSIAIYHLDQPPSLAIANLVTRGTKIDAGFYPREYAMKIIAFTSLVAVLRSLLLWSNRGDEEQPKESVQKEVDGDDDPSQFESNKKNKKEIDLAVADFNYKAERGIKRFIASGIMKDEPHDIARVLITTPGINLAMLGDYLGKQDSMEICHHFVDQIDMVGLGFVDAFRVFLQKFRLPGEGQVVDRFVLEFASKYVQDNPTVFTDANVPYMLAYSVVLLNTDLHNNQVKRQKMSLEAFIQNNRSINEPLGLPEEFQRKIYEDIAKNEIKLDSEQEYHAIKGDIGGGVSAEDAYQAASEAMMSRTAKMFKSTSTSDAYYNASHTEHIHPMLDLTWMSFLAGFSGPFQQTDNEDIIELCVEGLGLATRICCHYNIELGRISFIQALVKFTSLSDYGAIKPKNIAIIRSLLRLALQERDNLGSSWYDIIVVIAHISQLERAQTDSMPNFSSFKSDVSNPQFLDPENAKLICSRENIINCDKAFTQSSVMSLAGILDFVKALCSVSLQEIDRPSKEPQLFCLQKIVDVCYYNMDRIKVEWLQIWKIMNEQFDQVCVNPDEQIYMFALDSLRQLSLRFLEMDELSHFQFQKDFLAPFEYTMKHHTAASAKRHSIECLRQLLLSKHKNMRSGWVTISNTLAAAATAQDSVLLPAFELLLYISQHFLDVILPHTELLNSYLRAVTSMARQPNSKVALQCADLLLQIFDASDDPKMWDLITGEFHAVVMTAADPEVRSKSLQYLFDILMEHGSRYSKSEWDLICRDKLFPLFYILEAKNAPLSEEQSIWISTTLWQALQKVVDLFTKYFEVLSESLDVFFLELLRTCICQENDDVSRMGFRSLLTLIRENATSFSDVHWGQIGLKIEQLFASTTPKELEAEAFKELQGQTVAGEADANSLQAAIPKTVHHLRLIETMQELFSEQVIFDTMPIQDIIKVLDCLKTSYEFSRTFNRNTELRREICEKGFMKHVPNLSRNERTAAKVYVQEAMKLFRARNRFESEQESRDELRQQIFPVCTVLLKDYNELNARDHRHVTDLMPVVVIILKDVCALDSDDFKANVSQLYIETIQLLNKDLSSDLRESIQAVLLRVAQVHMVN